MNDADRRHLVMKRCALVGAILGGLLALLLIAFAYLIAPSAPGTQELVLQLLGVLASAGVAAAIGAIIGYAIAPQQGG